MAYSEGLRRAALMRTARAPRKPPMHTLPIHRPRVAGGREHFNSRLTEAQVIDARKRVAAGESRASVGRDLGVASQTIGQIIAGKLWRHV